MVTIASNKYRCHNNHKKLSLNKSLCEKLNEIACLRL
jgi:hypothetical protein